MISQKKHTAMGERFIPSFSNHPSRSLSFYGLFFQNGETGWHQSFDFYVELWRNEEESLHV